MSKPIRIFIEYNVKASLIQQYEEQMKKVLNRLPTFGADQVIWYKSKDQTYIESFLLPTVSHFIALRKIRSSEGNTTFGILSEFIEGGPKNIQIHAIKVK